MSVNENFIYNKILTTKEINPQTFSLEGNGKKNDSSTLFIIINKKDKQLFELETYQRK